MRREIEEAKQLKQAGNPFRLHDGSGKTRGQVLEEIEADSQTQADKSYCISYNNAFRRISGVNDHPHFDLGDASRFHNRINGLGSPSVLTRDQIKNILAAFIRGNVNQDLKAKYDIQQESSGFYLISRHTQSKVLPLEAYYQYVFQVHYMLGHSLDIQAHHQYMYKNYKVVLIDDVYRVFHWRNLLPVSRK